jgi:hypothetical protein
MSDHGRDSFAGNLAYHTRKAVCEQLHCGDRLSDAAAIHFAIQMARVAYREAERTTIIEEEFQLRVDWADQTIANALKRMATLETSLVNVDST